MTVNYTTNLALGQPVTGTESGTWGDDVNNAVTSYLDIAIAGGLSVTVTTADVTLTNTQGTSVATNIGSTTAQYAILNVSGAMTAARNLIVPSSSRIYLINNNTTGGFALTVKGSATSGVTLVNGEKAHVFWNGTDYAKLSNASGGAGVFSSITNSGLTSGRVVYSTTGGLETDSANLTFNGTTLTANTIGAFTLSGTIAGGGNQINNVIIGTTAPLAGSFTTLTASTSITNSSLTTGRVVYTTTGGLETSSANLLYSGTDLTVYGLTVGRGAGAVSTNTAVGASALAANTTGAFNVAVGPSALNANVTGSQAVAIGYQAGKLATAGNITAVGTNALQANTTGNYNDAFGVGTLFANTTGAFNVAFGSQSLQANTTASNNTAVGYQASYSGTTGANNTALGYQAGYGTTTGASNTSVGHAAFLVNSTGDQNVAFGQAALYSNTTGSYNVALGRAALQANTTASNNTAVGYQAGYSNAGGGSQLTFVGYRAGYSNTAGVNAAFGADALYSNTTGDDNTAIGSYRPLYSNTTGSSNIAIGRQALFSNTTASNNTAVGYQAGYTNSTGAANTYIGKSSGYNATSSYNTLLGDSAGYYITSGAKNTILGSYNGNQGSLDIRTASNYIVLSDGDGNPRAYWNGANATFNGTISPVQATTAGAPAYVKGAMYFDTTLNKMRIGGATGWETVTSV